MLRMWSFFVDIPIISVATFAVIVVKLIIISRSNVTQFLDKSQFSVL